MDILNGYKRRMYPCWSRCVKMHCFWTSIIHGLPYVFTQCQLNRIGFFQKRLISVWVAGWLPILCRLRTLASRTVRSTFLSTNVGLLIWFTHVYVHIRVTVHCVGICCYIRVGMLRKTSKSQPLLSKSNGWNNFSTCGRTWWLVLLLYYVYNRRLTRIFSINGVQKKFRSWKF